MIQLELTNSPTIKVVVGPEGRQHFFYIHESVLEARSKKSTNAVKQHTSPHGNERMIRFPDEDEEAFALYFDFAYNPTAVHEHWQGLKTLEE